MNVSNANRKFSRLPGASTLLDRCSLVFCGIVCIVLSLTATSLPAAAQGYGFAEPGAYGLKIYQVNSAHYPYVQVYFRTFDQNMQPLVNLNAMNIGLMVKGRAYDPKKQQYQVSSIRQRQEATRSVLVLDASKTMAGLPFQAAVRAAARYIDSKRPQDEVAILAIRDTKTGFDVVSTFERDPGALGRRLVDIKADGQKTRLYDSLGAAMQMCAATAQGSVSPTHENFIVSCSVIVFSDGLDEGSALSREELNTRISGLTIPIPVYSLAYSKVNQKFFKNLESISKNSFGIYYLVGEAYDKMQQIVEQIQNIIQSDYVVTFKTVLPVDGEEHALKLGVEYPSGSGKFTYESAKFEAIEPPPVSGLLQEIQRLDAMFPKLPAGSDPYFDRNVQAPPPSSTSPSP